MAAADTAKLLASLELQDKFTPTVKSALSGTAQLEAKLGGGFGRIGAAAGKMGGAVSHAGSQLKSLVSGPLGLLGLGAGLFSVAGALEKGISKAQTWGLQIEKLTGITGDSAEALSGLLAVTEKYGLDNERLSQIAAFTEKSLGNLTKGVDDQGHAVKGALAFQAQFGFSIYDTAGKVKDFNSLLLTFADYWTSSASATDKAAAAAKLFGRGFADLVPVLNLGSKGIQAAEEEAASLGLTLTSLNVKQLAEMRENTRRLGDAVGGLELHLGLALIPTINELATGIASFIGSHRTDIVTFFKNAVQAAENAGRTIIGFGQAVAGAWNAIPPGVRDILTKGLIADRTVKFLFGFDPAGSLIHGLEAGIANAFGKSVAAAGIGKLFVQPVFVTNPGFGGLGGLPAAAGAASSAAEAVVTTGAAITVGSVIASIIAGGGLALIMAGVGEYVLSTSNDPTGAKGRLATATARGLNPAGVDAGTRTGGPLVNAIGAASKQIANAVDDWKGEAHRLTATMNAGDKDWREAHAAVVKAAGRDYALTAGRDTLLKEIRDASIARYGGTGLGPAAVEATYEHRLLFATERIMDNGQSTDDKISQLKEIEDTLLSDGDTKTRGRIDTLITKLENQRPPTVDVNVYPQTTVTVSGLGYLSSPTTRVVNGAPVTVVSRN